MKKELIQTVTNIIPSKLEEPLKVRENNVIVYKLIVQTLDQHAFVMAQHAATDL